MCALKTKSLEHIEQRMQVMDEGSFRYQVLQNVKSFKTSWIDLGQALYAVWKDKMYKEWGFLTFEAYTAKEIGIQKQTAVKLLKSYYFLEKEEPKYLEKNYKNSDNVTSLPSYESVNVLRLAKSDKRLGERDYEGLKKEVFEKGKEPKEIKKDLTALIREREDVSPEEARKRKTQASFRRFISTLKGLRRDLELSKMISADVLRDTDALIKKIEAEL